MGGGASKKSQSQLLQWKGKFVIVTYFFPLSIDNYWFSLNLTLRLSKTDQETLGTLRNVKKLSKILIQHLLADTSLIRLKKEESVLLPNLTTPHKKDGACSLLHLKSKDNKSYKNSKDFLLCTFSSKIQISGRSHDNFLTL